MKQFFGFLLAILRIYIIVKILILLYNARQGFSPEQIDSALWWALFLIFDIWFQIIIPMKDDNDD